MFEQISRWKKGVTMKRFKLLVLFHPLRLFLDVEQCNGVEEADMLFSTLLQRKDYKNDEIW